MNTFVCTAKIGRTPETFEGKNGDLITKLLLKVGNDKGDDDYFEAVILGDNGKYACEHLKQDDRILVEGKLQNRYWQNKNGETRQKAEIKIRRYEFLERRGKNCERENNQRTEKENRDMVAEQL